MFGDITQERPCPVDPFGEKGSLLIRRKTRRRGIGKRLGKFCGLSMPVGGCDIHGRYGERFEPTIRFG